MGLGAELAALIAEEAFLDLDAPIRRVTGPDLPGIPFNDIGEHAFLPNADKIADALRALARYSPQGTQRSQRKNLCALCVPCGETTFRGLE